MEHSIGVGEKFSSSPKVSRQGGPLCLASSVVFFNLINHVVSLFFLASHTPCIYQPIVYNICLHLDVLCVSIGEAITIDITGIIYQRQLNQARKLNNKLSVTFQIRRLPFHTLFAPAKPGYVYSPHVPNISRIPYFWEYSYIIPHIINLHPHIYFLLVYKLLLVTLF